MLLLLDFSQDTGEKWQLSTELVGLAGSCCGTRIWTEADRSALKWAGALALRIKPRGGLQDARSLEIFTKQQLGTGASFLG